MNIALGALIILLLLLPALFFRLGITVLRFSGKRIKQADTFSLELARRNFINVLSKLSFSDTLFFFSIVPLLLHLFAICLLSCFGIEIDFKLLLNILSSQKDAVIENMTFKHEVTFFLWYMFFQTLLGFLSGIFLTRLFSRIPNLNRILIGENFYLRLFSGLLMSQDKLEQIDLILVEITSENKEHTVIYSGFLEKFDINADKNELAYITLTGTRRRNDDQTHNDMAPIPGKYFTISGSKISNINVTYIHLQTITDDDGEHQIAVPID